MARSRAALTVIVSAVALLSVAGSDTAGQVKPAQQQVAAAVLAAPADRREAAAVMGYDAAGRLTTLRRGTNDLVCLADNPDVEGFEVACYHVSLEPYMARGRALTEEGVEGMDRYNVRWEEAKQGKLAMPERPAMLYVLSGSGYDAATHSVADEYRRSSIYIPFATAESTGLSEQGSAADPWIMFPGTPGAHIMITPPRPSGG